MAEFTTINLTERSRVALLSSVDPPTEIETFWGRSECYDDGSGNIVAEFNPKADWTQIVVAVGAAIVSDPKKPISECQILYITKFKDGAEALNGASKITVRLSYTPHLGDEEGDKCNRQQCDGVMHCPPPENCTCFISSPCSSCTSRRLKCNKCGFEVES